jgi:hypothetical protein
MENQEQEAKDGYREIVFCEFDRLTLEPATCRNLRDSPVIQVLLERGLRE